MIRRTTPWFGSAALAALVLATPAQSQQPPAAPGGAERVGQVIAAVNAGDRATLQAFVREHFAPEALGWAPEDAHVWYLSTLARPGGLRGGAAVRSGVDRWATGMVNATTEEVDSLWVSVEPASPHRITRVSFGGGAGGAGAAAAALPTTDGGRAAELRRYVAKLAAADEFSGVVLLAKDGRPLVLEGFGAANRDFHAPVRRDTKFNLGSANKNLTAVVIGQLVEEGRLSWDDPLSRFLPDFPDSAAARRVRVKHLLSHTSGLGSYFNRRFMEGSRARFRTVDDYMALARPDSLRFEPGTRWKYSNSGFLVLGKIIELVEGKPYDEVVRARITGPLVMRSTDTYALDRVNRNLAVGYIREITPIGVTVRNNIFEHVIQGGPAGGGYSTAEDMLRYAEALRGGRLVRRATLELMRTPKPELSSPRYGYGFALFDGSDVWGHGGDFPGVDFDLHQYGDSGYAIVLLANYDGVNDPILRKVKRMLQASGAVAAR